MDRSAAMTRADGWLETDATIVSCKQGWMSALSEGVRPGDGYYEPPVYTVTFTYHVAGRTFGGKYSAGSMQSVGEKLKIAYDPDHPDRNTASDAIQNPWHRALLWVLGGGLTALAIWLGFPGASMPF